MMEHHHVIVVPMTESLPLFSFFHASRLVSRRQNQFGGRPETHTCMCSFPSIHLRLLISHGSVSIVVEGFVWSSNVIVISAPTSR